MSLIIPNRNPSLRSELLVAGCGPAGLSTVVSALKEDVNVTVVDPDRHPGAGNLSHIIPSNSMGEHFRQGYEGVPVTPRKQERIAGIFRPVPLSHAARYLRAVGDSTLKDPRVSHVQASIEGIQLSADGFEIAVRDAPRSRCRIQHTKSIALALGAEERFIDVLRGRNLHSTFLSGNILKGRHLIALHKCVATYPEIGIVGGASSAYSVAAVLRKRFPRTLITLFKNSSSPTKVYFSSVDECCRLGYKLQPTDTIDPETLEINRFDGIRGDARDVWFDEQEGRAGSLVRTLNDYDLRRLPVSMAIIQATGYVDRARSVPLYNQRGQEVPTSVHRNSEGFSELRTGSNGEHAIPGIIALGLGTSPNPAVTTFHGYARAGLAHLELL